MPGTAILDPDVLIDDLVPEVIDGLRGDLHPEFGVRAYRVFTVKRTWSGSMVGEGSVSEVTNEITPQPKVLVWTGLKFELRTCGLDDMGEIQLREVSLTYTHLELTGKSDAVMLGKNQEFLIKLTEAHGQGNPVRYFQHSRPPFVDRENDMGWVVWLRDAKKAG
jgi:hypothetical protein